MRQAIKTIYMGPTNTKPTRIKAICDSGVLTENYEGQGISVAHKDAAKNLVNNLGWNKFKGYAGVSSGYGTDGCNEAYHTLVFEGVNSAV